MLFFSLLVSFLTINEVLSKGLFWSIVSSTFQKLFPYLSFLLFKETPFFYLTLNRRKFYFKSVFCLYSVGKRKGVADMLFSVVSNCMQNLRVRKYISLLQFFLRWKRAFFLYSLIIWHRRSAVEGKILTK